MWKEHGYKEVLASGIKPHENLYLAQLGSGLKAVKGLKKCRGVIESAETAASCFLLTVHTPTVVKVVHSGTI